MGTAKNLRVAPIAAQDANRLVKKVHYSGKVVNNTQLHFGVFWNGRLEGALQFGPSLDRRKLITLVTGTKWNDFLELNRLAFTDGLPRNSESRAIAVAMRLIRKHYPNIQWIVSFADGTQCGDGTIYRASGFVLTGIKKNTQIWAAPSGEHFARHVLTIATAPGERKRAQNIVARHTVTKGKNLENGAASMKQYKEAGFRPLPGYQLRYIYFLDPTARDRLTVPILPFSEIERQGARMYKGKRVVSDTGDTSAVQAEKGGSTPTTTLQT